MANRGMAMPASPGSLPPGAGIHFPSHHNRGPPGRGLSGPSTLAFRTIAVKLVGSSP
jgi:hypothetical protein